MLSSDKHLASQTSCWHSVLRGFTPTRHAERPHLGHACMSPCQRMDESESPDNEGKPRVARAPANQ